MANLATGIKPSILDISGLSVATLGSTDQLLAVQGATAKKTTLGDLETKLWADTVAHIGGLTALTSVADTDVFHTIRSGAEKKVTPVELATYMVSAIGSSIVGTAFDSDAVVSLSSGDLLLLERSGVRKTGTVDLLVGYTSSVLAASSALTPAAGDKVLVYRSGAAGLEDIDALASYVTPAILASAAVTSALETDTVLLGRSGATKQITFANLQTEILDGVQATTLNLSGLSTATLERATIIGLPVRRCHQNDPDRPGNEAWADFAVYLAALTDAGSGRRRQALSVHGTHAQVCHGTELATYVGGKLWEATPAAASLTGDKMLMYRTGTGMMQVTVDLLQDFITADIQADTLDLSDLDAATIGTTDQMLFCQGGTARQATVEALTTSIHDKFSAYLASLDEVTLLSDTAQFYLSLGGAAKRVSLDDLADYIFAESADPGWTTIPSSKYTAVPSDTSAIAMSDTSDLAVGLPVKYTFNSTTYYGLVTAVSANASITIAGAPLDTGYPITELCVGSAERVVQVELQVNSIWDDAVQDILAGVEERYFRWQKSKAYLVAFSGTQHWVDSGAAQPWVNVKVNGNLVSTNSSDKGIELSGTAGTWVDNSAVAISPANYVISRGQSIELRCTQVGTTGDAECLTVSLVFVYE